MVWPELQKLLSQGSQLTFVVYNAVDYNPVQFLEWTEPTIQ